MKKSISILLTLTLIFTIFSSISFANEDIKVKVNGNFITFDQPPIIKNGRTLVPIRFISEELGAKVYWNGVTRMVTVIQEDKEIRLVIGDITSHINDKKFSLDQPAEIVNGRTLVPIRFVSEALGVTVDWDGTTRTVIITKGDKTTEETNEQDNDSTNKELNPTDVTEEDVFNKPNIDDISNSYAYKVVDNKILFKLEDGTYTDLDTTNNPYINEQVYNVTKALISDDHYVETFYSNSWKNAVIKYGKGKIGVEQYNATQFDYLFYEDYYDAKDVWNYDKFSDKVFASLDLSRLWWESEEKWSIPYYEDKLKNSLIAVFGEDTGIKIFDYVLAEYLEDRIEGRPEDTDSNPFNNYIYETKEIDNIHIDYARDSSATLMFFFSYK